MGLASKLAAAQAGAYIYNQAQNQGSGQQPRPPSSPQPPAGAVYPGGQQYQAYNQNQQYPPQQQNQQYPPQQQYGQQYPPQGQQQYHGYGQGSAPESYSQGNQHYGAYGPVSFPQDVTYYQQLLERHVQERQLREFFPPGSEHIKKVASLAPRNVGELCQKYQLPIQVGQDLAKLGLYDTILYVDDSASMQFDQGGERIDDLKLILHRVTDVCTRFDTNGIDVRFMNSRDHGDNITNESEVNRLMHNRAFVGITPLGTELKNKIIDKIVLPRFHHEIKSNSLTKPILIITITDGEPNEPNGKNDTVFETIYDAIQVVKRKTHVPHAIAFEFAQVGNDKKAQEFLSRLDADRKIGSMVDCTSNYEQESEEMIRKDPPVQLTPDLWMMKLLLGAIDPSYDSKDEKRSNQAGFPASQPAAQGHAAPPGDYQHYSQQMNAPTQSYYPPQSYQQAPNQGYQQTPSQGYQPQPSPYNYQQQPPLHNYQQQPPLHNYQQQPPPQGYQQPPSQGYHQPPQQYGYPPQQAGGSYYPPPSQGYNAEGYQPQQQPNPRY